MGVTFLLPFARCLRCGYDWHPRIARVSMCPRCKSLLWNVPKKAERKRADTRKRP